MPRDFPETFARVGWEAIEEETRAHKTTILAWGDAYGWDALRQMRRTYLEAEYAKRGHRVPGRKPGTAARYVMGRTRNVQA